MRYITVRRHCGLQGFRTLKQIELTNPVKTKSYVWHSDWTDTIMQLNSNNTEYPDIPENFPSISIVIPFETKMSTTTGLHTILATAISNEEKKLLQSFPENEARPVIDKLHDLVRNLKGAKRYKSVGIFVSPHASKVYYFNYSEQEN